MCRPLSLSSSHSSSALTHIQCGSFLFLSAAIPGTVYRLVYAVAGDSLKTNRIDVENPGDFHNSASAEVGPTTTRFPVVFLQPTDGSPIKIVPEGVPMTSCDRRDVVLSFEPFVQF